MIVNFLFASIMTQSMKQKYCIEFSQKLGNNQIETIQNMLQAFGDEALSQTQIKKWFNHFQNSQMSAKSEARSGRPFTSQNEEVIEKIHQIVMKDHCLTLRKIFENVRIRRGAFHSILTEDLCMQRVLAKFIPKLLMEQQK